MISKSSKNIEIAIELKEAYGLMQNDHNNDFDQQLEHVEERYKHTQARQKKQAGGSQSKFVSSGVALALRAATDMFSAILVGGLIGWGCDHYFHIHGICLSIFILLGCCAGVLNVIRVVNPREDNNERDDRGK